MLSIITEPWGIDKFYFNIRRLAAVLIKGTPFKQYGGHFAVRRSLVAGLTELNFDFNFNPKRKYLGREVLVLSNKNALRQCIDLKKKGLIKYLIAGPNLVSSSRESNAIITNPLIDLLVLPSGWMASYFCDESESLKGKIACWPAGVDVNYWSPSHNYKSKVLVYYKNSPKKILEEVAQLLKELNIQYEIIYYGSYNSEKFKWNLNDSYAAIFLSKSETQGIAIAEAWAMNVPTLVWRTTEKISKGYAQPAPYLSSTTGALWENLEELKTLLSTNLNSFNPRRWMLDNQTDRILAQELVNIIYKK